MKKNIISAVVLLAVAALVTSCAKELQPNNSTSGGNVTFTGVIEQFGEGTKTVLNSSHAVEWESTDEVRIEDGFFSVTPDGTDATKASFTFQSGTEPTVSPYYAYYPPTLYDDAKLTLPETQTYTAGKITNNPMYAKSSTSNFSFHNLCGLVEFTLKGTATISKIAVAANAGGLSGDFEIVGNKAVLKSEAKTANKGVTLDCGTGVTLNNDPGVKFWIAIPEGTYTLVFTVYDTEGKVFQQVTKAGVTVTANNIYAFEKTPSLAGYLCFTALEADATVAPCKSGSPTTNALEYKTVIGGTEADWADLVYGTPLPTLTSAGDKVYFRAKEARIAAQNALNYIYFTADKKVEVSGNIMYLVDPMGSSTTISRGYEFYALFYNGGTNTTISKADKLVLPATTLADRSYQRMFSGCSSLTAAPALPATTLADYSYSSMFEGCLSLTTAPALPATTLASSCYRSMFYDCSNLTTAPALPAPTLVDSCYYEMFYGCMNLVSITCLATNIGATDCTKDWVHGVSSSGTFTIASAEIEAAWSSGKAADDGKPVTFTYSIAS